MAERVSRDPLLGRSCVEFDQPMATTPGNSICIPPSHGFWFVFVGWGHNNHGSGWDIEVAEGCSAFHNTITTAFVWLSLIKIQRLDFHFKYFVILAIGLAFVVLLNTARIGIMAVSQSEYDFWHWGPGQRIVKYVMLSAVLGLFYFGLRPPRSDTSGQTRV